MQQTYRYGDPHTAFPEAGVDGSRVIALFIFNTDVHMHAYPADGLDGRGARTAAQLDEALATADVLVMLVDHSQFKVINGDNVHQQYVVDAKGVWR